MQTDSTVILPDYQQSVLEKTYLVIQRNGNQTAFDRNKIMLALSKAFLAVEGGAALDSSRVHDKVKNITQQVVAALTRYLPEAGRVHIENIQDQVELALMRNGEHKVARAYVLYREQHARERVEQTRQEFDSQPGELLRVVLADNSSVTLAQLGLRQSLEQAATQLTNISVDKLMQKILSSIHDGISEKNLNSIVVMSARSLIEQEPNYSQLAARLLLHNLRQEAHRAVFDQTLVSKQAHEPVIYHDYFKAYISKAVELELLDPALLNFNLDKLANAIVAKRDLQFTYLGLQTLYDRYFLQSMQQRLELPQAFFMRVAMGLAIKESQPDQRCIEFYHLLSSFDFMCSTPTLFNSGSLRAQLSSCFLTSVPDDLAGIYSALKDCAMLSKFSGGLGNDWSRVRGLGAQIKGTNGQSQGIVPFLKVANDTAVAVNQGGKRKGAMCAYLESWHIDIEEFLELRKNTGDDRRRTHDMNSANWIPDLFMQRVVEQDQWTLFSPEEVPDLHDLYGKAFAQAYVKYESMAAQGKIKIYRTIAAQDLWRKMLSMLFETGHPWITFKDPCNVRYTNQHIASVRSSNLCTEITLHSNDEEIAVCNLGSVNLAAHIDKNGLNKEKLQTTITTAMRMLDNVIDCNYYSVEQARHFNLRHRPVGLGIMGFQDALYKLDIAYASEQALQFADNSMELVSYFAIQACSDLAVERGSYSTFSGSLWSQGILPLDSIEKLAEQRGSYFHCDRSATLDWDKLRKKVQSQGMRNSNCLAIAPTATISNICGVSQSIEPSYQNLFVKSNLSGEFIMINPYLVNSLKQYDLWDEVMLNDLKYYDGSLEKINRIPDKLKTLYKCAFEIDPRWLVEAAARRQKWIDQAQSLNLYLAEPSGKKLDQVYKLAWVRGLKTTYYLRSIAATAIEKTLTPASESISVQQCSLHASDCEACQ